MSSDLDDKTRLADRPAASYDTYTDSGVDWLGTIPAHWELRALKYSADFVQEKLDSKPEDLPYIGLEHIESGTGKLVKDAPVEDVSSKVVHFEAGDVLFGKLRPYLAKVLLAEERGVGTTELVPMRPVNDVDEQFLAYQLLSKGFIDVVDAQTYGARMPRVSPDQLAEQKIVLPPPDEQRAIAAFLDRATARIDALIDRKERLIDLLEEKRSALVSHLVTTGLDDDAEMQDSGVEWLGEIPAGWDVVRLKFLTSLVTSGPRGWAEYYSDDGATFLQVGNLSRGSLDLDLSEVEHVDPPENAEGTRTRLQANDLLLSITAYIGSIGVVPSDLGEAYVNQHIALVRPLLDERAHSRWLGYCLLSQVGQSQFGELLYGGTKDGLSLQDVKDLRVLLPPLVEQRAIADHLDEKTAQIDALIERVQDGIERLREYRTALLSAAVTGEIDVREQAKERTDPRQPAKEIDTWARMNLVIELIRRMRKHKHFGRVMLVKMLYLIEHHLRVDGMRMTYRRKDFGPYDPSFRYGLEEKLEEQDWYRTVEKQRSGFRQTEYIPLERAEGGKGQEYFQSSWGDVEEQIDEIVRHFRKFDTTQAEIVATLYAAWNDLLILDQPHSDDDIIREVLSNWHPRKQDIEEETWRDALQWMKDEGLVPTGYGDPTVGANPDE